jgi:hypothetical protein
MNDPVLMSHVEEMLIPTSNSPKVLIGHELVGEEIVALAELIEVFHSEDT